MKASGRFTSSFALSSRFCTRSSIQRSRWIAVSSRFLRRGIVSQASLDWSTVKTEDQFRGLLRAAESKGFLSNQFRVVWEDFYDNYKETVLSSGVEGHDEKFVLEMQRQIADRVFHQFQEPFTFPPHHERILAPFNYYEFGQRYVGSLINFKESFVGNLDIWQKISNELHDGHNIVLLANHQTEADPGVFAHMIKTSFPKLAEDVIYVAGDRVITDPLCKPFTMGRNCFCVYSKRHIDDVPELKESKIAMNRKTIMKMRRELNEGNNLMWIAPSGGRDRPNAEGQWLPNSFDPGSVGLMHTLLSKAKKKGHLYVLAMVSWKMMPPPVRVEETIGERRETNFTGVGMSVAPEIDVEEVLKDVSPEGDAYQIALAKHARDVCEEEYLKLSSVIDHPELRSKYPQYEQPWLKQPVAS